MSSDPREYTGVPGVNDVEALSAPAYDAFPITPGEELEAPTRYLYVGKGGDVQVTTLRGRKVTFKDIDDSSILPVRCTAVHAEGTEAENIMGML